MNRNEEKRRVYGAVKAYYLKKSAPVPAIHFRTLGVDTVTLKLLVRDGLLEESFVTNAKGVSYRAYAPRGYQLGIQHPVGGELINVAH